MVFIKIESFKSNLYALIPESKVKRIGIGCGIGIALLASIWATLRNQSQAPVYTREGSTPIPDRPHFYLLHGYANPASRCAGIFSSALPETEKGAPPVVLAGNPRHIIPGFGPERNTDLVGLRQFAADSNIRGHKVLLGHSCGAVDAINHVLNGTLPDGIEGVIAVSPFAHINDIADLHLPERTPDFIRSCIRAIVSTVLWKFRSQSPLECLTRLTLNERARPIPILILGCEGDMVVSTESTRRLFTAMRTRGFNVTLGISPKPPEWAASSVHDYAGTTPENIQEIQTFMCAE